MPAKDTARDAAFSAMRSARDEIVRICSEIHEHPEPAGEERRAVERLTEFFKANGFEIETGIAGMPTAWRATIKHHDTEAMRKGLRHGHMAFLLRADADPASGHVDGAPAGIAAILGAALGLSKALDSEYGTVTVIGYPGDSSLVAMARAGMFNEFDAVLGARPASAGRGFCYTIDGTGDTLASRTATITVDGDRDAFVTAVRNETSSFEQPSVVQIASKDDGTLALTLTARTTVELRELTGAIQRLVDETPGVTVSYGEIVEDMIVNRILARRVKTYADTLGRSLDKVQTTEPGPATGWGNVSYVAPTFVFDFPFTTDEVERGTPAFAAAAARSTTYDRALELAECLCMTGLDILRDMQYRATADDQLVKALAKRGVTRQHRRWLGVHPVIKSPEETKPKKKGPKLADFKMVRGPGMRDN